MNIFIGIKSGKVWDMCSELIYKRDDDPLLNKDYFEVDLPDVRIGDTWVSATNTNLKDAPGRTAEPEKTPEEIRMDEIETRLAVVEDKTSEISATPT